MSMTKITERHIEDLSEGLVDSWDLDTLIEYAKEKLSEHYKTLSAKEFAKEWENVFGDTFPNK